MGTIVAEIHGTDGEEALVEVNVATARSMLSIVGSGQGTLIIGDTPASLHIPACEIARIVFEPVREER